MIKKIKNKEDNVEIPIFNKMLFSGKGDREGSKIIEYTNNLDLVIFEGWFVGLSHLKKNELENNPIISSSNKLAMFSNENLKDWDNWDFLDTLIVLKPKDFEYSFKWRLEAERRQGGKSGGMSDEEIKDFVQYFINSLDPGTYYGKLIKDSIEGEGNIGLLIELDERREALSYDFFQNEFQIVKED